MAVKHCWSFVVLHFVCGYVMAQYDSVRYDMTSNNVHWNSLADFNSKGFNPDTLSKPLFCQSETTPVFTTSFSKTNDYNAYVATATNVLDAGSHWNVAGVYTQKQYNLTTHSVKIKGAFLCRTTTIGDYNEYWLGAIPGSNKNYHPAIYGSANAPEGYIIGAWVDWWCARTRGSTSSPDVFFINRINANMPLGLFFEAMAEFKIVHDSVMMVKYVLTPPNVDSYVKQVWAFPTYRSTPFEPLSNAPWFKNFRPAFMADDALDWVEVVADPLPCTLELKKKSISVCEGASDKVDLSTLIWLKSQSIDNKTGVFYLRKSTNSLGVQYLNKALTNALLPKSLPKGDYWVSYISPCGDSIQIPLSIKGGPEVVLRDTVLCEGALWKPQSTIKTSSSIIRYSWQCGNNVGSTSQPIWTMGDTGLLNYRLNVTDLDGCVGGDTATVYVSSLGGLSLSINDSIQCFRGHNFVLRANSVAQSRNKYQWNLPNGQRFYGSEILGYRLNSMGLYTVRLVASTPWGCKDSIDREIQLLESPKVVVFDTQVCENQWFRVLHKDVILVSPILKHSWTFNGTDSSIENPTYKVVQSGLYSLRLIIENAAGCSDTGVGKVMVHPKPQINYDFRFLDNLNGGSRWTYLYTGTQGAKVQWLMGEREIGTGSGPGIFNLDQMGVQNFKIRVTSNQGCVDSMMFSKTISLSNDIYYPNAFTPDGHGGNEVFGPYNADLIENYRLRVYNRWGEKLFESTSNNRYWNGTDSKGDPAMEGQYVYVVSGVKNSGQTLNHAGTVYLIRYK